MGTILVPLLAHYRSLSPTVQAALARRLTKKVPIYQRFLSEAVNHKPDIMPTTFMGPDPNKLINSDQVLHLMNGGAQLSIMLAAWKFTLS